MKPAVAAILATALALSGCVAYPVPVAQGPTPLLAGQDREECILIRSEIARQQRIAALSPVMETALVEAAVRLNVSNVISGLETRAAIEGCRV
jgi:hypothetical protein